MAAAPGARIGLLGGSFNPAHDGHVHISLLALRLLRLDAVWWLVSPQNPLKPAADMAPFAERLSGAERVARGHAGIRVTDIEARLGTRYSVDTLEALVRAFPAARFVWLIGADNLVQLPRWRRWTRIFELVPVAVFDRAPYSFVALAGMAAKRFRRRRMRQRDAGRLAESAPPAWVYIRMRLHPASATALRARRLGAAKRKR
jgi:nicotinate-nucleotide adenylyltransferase